MASNTRTGSASSQGATAGDATELTKNNYYATVALCTVEKTQDFTAATDTTVMAVVSKVVAPSKSLQHTVDLYIDAMEPVSKRHSELHENDMPDATDCGHTIGKPCRLV